MTDIPKERMLVVRDMLHDFGIERTPQEIAKGMEISVAKIRECLVAKGIQPAESDLDLLKQLQTLGYFPSDEEMREAVL